MMKIELLASRLCLALAFSLTANVGFSQSPVIQQIRPTGVQRGKTVDITVSGTNLAGITGVWSSLPAKITVPDSIPKNGQEAGKLVLRVQVESDASVQLGAIRVATQKGISGFGMLMIDDLQPTVEAGGSSLAKPQKLELPCVVDGLVDSEGTDFYAVQFQKGQEVTIDLYARRLGSKLDGQVRILDARGVELAYADDSDAVAPDSLLRFVSPQSGRHIIEVRDIRYSGGAGHHYRLRIGDFPACPLPYPLGAKRASTTTIRGTGLTDIPPVAVQLTNTSIQSGVWTELRSRGGKVTPLLLTVGSFDELLEVEPNDMPDQATPAVFPRAINGVFASAEDKDRYSFQAKKGEKVTFETVSRQLGSPADLFMMVSAADGRELGSSDDNGKLDARLEFTAPADGTYALNVWELNQGFGASYVYRIVASTQPYFELLVRNLDKAKTSASGVVVPQGASATLLIRPVRRGYAGPIKLRAEGLPKGVTLSDTLIGKGQGDTLVTLTAAADVKFAVGAFQIVGTGVEGGWESLADAGEAVAASLNQTWPPIDLVHQLGWSISQAPKFTFKPEGAEFSVAREKVVTIPVTAQRSAEVTEAITFTIQGLPANVDIEVKPAAKGMPQGSVTIKPKKNAPVGTFSIAIVGTSKKDKSTFTATSTAVKLTISEK